MRKKKPENLKAAYTTVVMPKSFLTWMEGRGGVSRCVQDLLAEKITGLTGSQVEGMYAVDVRYKRSSLRAEHVRMARWMREGVIGAFKVVPDGDVFFSVTWGLSDTKSIVRLTNATVGFIHVCYDAIVEGITVDTNDGWVPKEGTQDWAARFSITSHESALPPQKRRIAVQWVWASCPELTEAC